MTNPAGGMARHGAAGPPLAERVGGLRPDHAAHRGGEAGGRLDGLLVGDHPRRRHPGARLNLRRRGRAAGGCGARSEERGMKTLAEIDAILRDAQNKARGA